MRTVLVIIILLNCCFPSMLLASDEAEITFPDETAKALNRLKHESINLLSEPVQSKNIVTTLGIIGVTSLTFIFDKEISEKVHKNGNNDLDKAARVGTLIGDPFIHLGLSAAVYGLGIATESPKWKETGEMMGEALILADASTLFIKEISGRGRPNATSSKGDFSPFGFKNDYDSFPSMHTSSSFALASVLSATSDNFALKTAYYSAATFVGLSRIRQNKHWASDVVFGAILGEVCGRIVTHYHASASKVAFAPTAIEGGVGLAMVGKW